MSTVSHNHPRPRGTSDKDKTTLSRHRDRDDAERIGVRGMWWRRVLEVGFFAGSSIVG
jgi:hypothetical protein